MPEIVVQHLQREGFLRPEAIGEGPVRRACFGGDVPDSRAVIALTEHYLEAGSLEGVFAGWFSHESNNTVVRIDRNPFVWVIVPRH